jgi:hypothetical protein
MPALTIDPTTQLKTIIRECLHILVSVSNITVDSETWVPITKIEARKLLDRFGKDLIFEYDTKTFTLHLG